MNNNTAQERGKILKFFSYPIVGIIGTSASLLGLLLGIYFYFSSKEERELVYFINPVRTEIVKKGDFSRLNIYYDSLKIHTDVTAIQIAFWNEGDLPIKKENILKNIEINIPAEFLEVTVRKVSRDVTHFALDANNFNTKKIGLIWDILEEDDGGVIQIIYAGKSDLDISITGVIEGQKVINEYEYSGEIKSASEQFNMKNPITNYILSSVLIILLIILISTTFKMLKKYNIKYKTGKFYVISVVIIILFSLFTIILNALQSKSIPPINF